MSTQASLEKMKLPTFDGNHKDWEHFKDKFTALIVNDTRIDPIVKMQHLNNCLSKEPGEKLRTIKFIGANFLTAWKALCNRYDNKYLRFSVQMEALVSMPSASTEQVAHLCLLINTVDDCVNTFESLGRPTKHWDDLFVYHVESKLAESTRRDWVRERAKLQLQDGFATYSELKKFIEARIQDLDVVEARVNSLSLQEEEASTQGARKDSSSGGRRRHFNQGQGKSSGVHVATKPDSPTVCSFCKGDHFIGFCRKFSGCSQTQRRAHVMTTKLCFNCLNANHTVESCQSKGRCIVCSSKHHTKLHQDHQAASNAVATVREDAETVSQESFNGYVNATHEAHPIQGMSATSRGKVLLATVCVLLQAPNGQTMTARALLDSGAEESFLTEHVVQTLSLKKTNANILVSGVGSTTTAVARSRVSVMLKSSQNSNFSFKLSALVLKKLSAMIPATEVRTHTWPHLEDLQLADPHYAVPARIDCILNANVYAAVLLPGIKRGGMGIPTAVNSVFGWVLMGAVASEEQQSSTTVHHVTVHHELSQTLARFWEIEEVPKEPMLTPAEHECYEHFSKTHTRNEQGRFLVRLPFVNPPKPLNTRGIAEACLQRLERRFQKQPELFKAYCAFMRGYLELGHMEVMPDYEVRDSDTYYMPHHPVVKGGDNNSIRVVFNASQKNSEGISLNSLFHTGPKLQEDVIVIVIQWAFSQVVFKCDVKKMFRQYLVFREDANWQRILWRESPNGPIKTYRLLTVTYGTAPAPFLANACVLQLAKDEEKKHPEGAKVLRRGRYVDDLFAGGDSLEEAIEVRNQLVDILLSAGMNVGKWAANRAELLIDINPEERGDNGVVFDEQEAVSALGLRWLSAEDAFCFQISLNENKEPVTKRLILSEVAKLYDPVGWLAPVIISAKILLQNLWLQGSDWDDPVSDEVRRNWITFNQQLKELEHIRISRWFGTFRTSSWEMHGFWDASERAYAVALYVVVRNKEGISSKLITAKSKVSPIKVISLPKLELYGASLMAKLVTYLLPKLDKQPSNIFCWTDSRIVLAWIQSHPSRWKAFVTNRVSEIVTSMPNAVWNHVSSADNPADLARRGISTSDLKNAAIWWRGPEWLQQSPSLWPSEQSHDFQTNEEARTKGFVAAFEEVAKFNEWMLSVSSMDKIVRILAYVHRWKLNYKKKAEDRRLSWFSAQELRVGRTYLMRLVQRECFAEEINTLKSNENVKNSSVMWRLSPFLDVEGLLRVGGRLQNAFLNDEEKHPVILPAKHHVTQLIIRKAHKVTLHGGPTLIQSYLSRQYWVIKGRNTIRRIARQCVVCARYRAVTLDQQMGPLPAIRTRPARPFSITGVDFAGPFSLKCSAGRGQKSFKGYVAIFICMVVRAVHIEVVSDLTTDAFLAAFRRFCSRRGLCQIVYSDNGKNFQGADAELRRLFVETSAMSQEIAAALAKDQVEWRFIPPRAPNFGGLWEAGVKSFKGHLRKIIGEAKLTFEEFSTVCTSIEACLNSRPLSALSSNEEDVAALTPGHFLIGAPLTALAEPFWLINESHSVSSRWHLLTLMRNHFWKRWQKEFLLQMQQRVKWMQPNRTLKVGDIVLYKDDLTPPAKWPLARIVKLYEGVDKLHRVACIRTASSEYKRPVRSLILLPTNEEASSHLVQLRTLLASEDKK